MNYSYDDDDDHDEDDLPVISLPKTSHFTRGTANENDDTENDHSMRLVGNWQSLYETSVHSLQSDHEDQRPTAQVPFYLERPPPIEKTRRELPSSPTYQPQIDSYTNKSKWQIRLPELLNGTVGPDRQNRDRFRRHTTDIVFQRPNSQHKEFNSSTSNETENDRPISPIVKQLKQKFDRMTSNNNLHENQHIPSQFTANDRPKLRRVTSLTSRELTANTGERLIRTPRPIVPIRPPAGMTTVKPRTASVGTLNDRPAVTNGRTHRERTNPPVSYSKHFYPPPSTTSFVKQLIGGGATMVYDSLIQSSAPKNNTANKKHQRSIEERTNDLRNTNSTLTGRQLISDTTSDTYATIKNKPSDKFESIPSKDDESEENYYEPISRQSSDDASERKFIGTPSASSSQLWNSRMHTTERETENYYPVYDMDD